MSRQTVGGYSSSNRVVDPAKLSQPNGMLLPFGAWVEAEGIEWCSVHNGVADEIGEDRGGACDLADHRPCVFHALYYREIRGRR